MTPQQEIASIFDGQQHYFLHAGTLLSVFPTSVFNRKIYKYFLLLPRSKKNIKTCFSWKQTNKTDLSFDQLFKVKEQEWEEYLSCSWSHRLHRCRSQMRPALVNLWNWFFYSFKWLWIKVELNATEQYLRFWFQAFFYFQVVHKGGWGQSKSGHLADGWLTRLTLKAAGVK